MVFQLVFSGLKRGKARFACAVAGIAAACGAVVFMFSLTATNKAQAPALAKRACAPWAAWRVEGQFGMRRGRGAQAPQRATQQRDGETPSPHRAPRGAAGEVSRGAAGDVAMASSPLHRGPKPDLKLDLVGAQIDYRPGGRVLQGPPMTAVIGHGANENPYGATKLVSGRWIDDGAEGFEVVCTKNTLRRFGKGEPPPLGSELKFVGQKGTMTAKVVGYLDDAKLPMGWPGVFANRAAFAAFEGETHGSVAFWRENPQPRDGAKTEAVTGATPAAVPARFLTADSPTVVESFKGDETRRMDYATPLLLVASVLTALCLLVNSLLIAVEANRKSLATLRTVGLARGGVLAIVAVESFLSTFCGWLLGCVGAAAVLVPYVACDPVAFPVGAAFSWKTMLIALVLAVVVAFAAILFALRPALAVRPLDALEERPRRRRSGMAIAFASGFAAFVAVEVWGASLMRAFVPSPEWPDAIVSILPAGVSSFDVEKLRGIEGVARISELFPIQLAFREDGAARDGETPSPHQAAQPRDGETQRKASGDVAMASSPLRGGQPMPSSDNALFLAAEWLPKFKFVEGDWESADKAIRSSDACVITLMMSRAKNLHKGDMLKVEMGGRGPKTPVDLPIAGVVDLNWHMVTSRGLVRGLRGASPMTTGPVFVSFDTAESVDPRPAAEVKMTHLWVEYKPEFLAEKGAFQAGREVELAIAKTLGLAPSNLDNHSTVRLHARDEIADGTLAHGTDVIGQAARVPFVFLAILALGFVAMLVAEADAARKSFATLRAVGATRQQLSARLAWRAVHTALLGMLVGLPVGALAGWLFTLKTGNWPGIPHYFVLPAGVIGEGAIGAIAFALIVAVPTAMILVGREMRRRP